MMIVSLGFAVAACGGASKADFISRADPVCSAANQRLKAAGDLPDIDVRYVTAAQLPVAAGYLDRVLPILRTEGSDLHNLGTPDDDGATVDDIRMFFDDFVHRLEDADAAAHRGDARTFTPTLARGLANGFQAQSIAERYGFSVCGKLPDLAR